MPHYSVACGLVQLLLLKRGLHARSPPADIPAIPADIPAVPDESMQRGISAEWPCACACRNGAGTTAKEVELNDSAHGPTVTK